MSKGKSRKFLKPALLTLSAALLVGSGLAVNAAEKPTEGKREVITGAYTSDYSSKEEALKAGLELNEKICEEGMVLLKNSENLLPFKTSRGTDAKKISVFGFATVRADGGGGDRAEGSAGLVKLQSTIYTSLEDAGYKVNPVLKDQYEEWGKVLDEKGKFLYNNDAHVKEMFDENKPAFEETYNEYGDAAVVMLKQGELIDGNPYAHSFDKTQYELLNYVEQHFSKVIVLINNSKPVELAKLQADPKVGAILVVGNPGDNGFDAVGKILNGSVNPSGKLSDTYPTDLKKDPSYNNYSYIGEKHEYPKYIVDGKVAEESYFVDYEEGIYMGYRYYETRAFEETKKDAGSDWFEKNVTYPFGYGLSYSQFEWNVKNASNGSLTPESTYKMSVEVKNTGKVAGKDVVQLYATTPYTTGGIEKSHVVLTDFAKTELLQPGESQVLDLEFDVRDIASYDYNDKNGNGVKGYELEKGEYIVSARRNSHEEIASSKFNVSKDYYIETSRAGVKVENQFDDVNAGVAKWQDQLSRTDLSKETTTPTDEERKLTSKEFEAWNIVVDEEYDKDPRWGKKAEDMPKYDEHPENRGKLAPVQLSQLIGKSYDDPLWDDLLDQLSLKEMEDLINYAGFGTLGIDYIGKPYVKETDGPKGWTGMGTNGLKFNMFAAEPVIAATWNKDLAYELGTLIGNQGIWGNSDNTNYEAGDKIYGYTGLYAPSMNLHRSPFDQRYTEYYSEDGVLSGVMAANTSLGAKSKGAYVYIKHFVCHDDGGGNNKKPRGDGTNISFGYRGGQTEESGLATWVDEQTLREVYMRPFQISVEEGEATAVMTAMNRLGNLWCGGHYNLITNVLRGEWGFRGIVLTDISIYGFQNVDQVIRAGGDCILYWKRAILLGKNDYCKANPVTQIYHMRRAAKNILYTTANSNAMQVPTGAKIFFNELELDDLMINSDVNLALNVAEFNTMSPYSDIKYEIVDGLLPEGLEMSEDGVVTGKVTEAGTFTITVEASAKGYKSATKTFTIKVNQPEVKEPIEDTEAREDIDKLNKDLADTQNALNTANTIAIVSLVISIVSVATLCGTIVLVVLKNKRN